MLVTQSTVNRLTKYNQLMQKSKMDAVLYYIKIGEELIKIKEKVPHGQWENALAELSNVSPEWTFASRKQSAKYMKVAREKHLALEVFGEEERPSINKLTKALSQATDEQMEQAEKKKADIANQMSSESKEWYTPEIVIELVMQVMGDIDLDPCSDPDRNVPARFHYTEEDDGMAHEWVGRVFMNPPYCGDTLKWCEKMIGENVDQAIVLVPSNTDTKYFHLMLEWCDAVCFVKGRLEFKPGEGNTGGRSTVRNVLFYKGRNRELFKTHFAEIGSVL
jgi:phage N-6-adenine-methyltransferase